MIRTSAWPGKLRLAALAILLLFLAVSTAVTAQAPQAYQVGEHIEVDWAGTWYTATITEYKNGFYTIKYDVDGNFNYVQPNRMRRLPGAVAPAPAPAALPPAQPVPVVGVDANGTVEAGRPILKCPVRQPRARNGDRPKAALLKLIMRCRLGEKAAAKGMDGAVTVDITSVQIGAPRPWRNHDDIGGGQPGTKVFPVKVTYTEREWYRTGTTVSADWIRVFNFFVNGFGEWEYGSVDTIKMPDHSEVPR